MSIQEKLDELKPHVLGIRQYEGKYIVEALFKDGWVYPPSDIIQQSAVDAANTPNYFILYSEIENVGLDDLLDYVEVIINVNIERELKYELLRTKVEELKILFRDNPLNKLKQLEFKISGSNNDWVDDFNLDGSIENNKETNVSIVKSESNPSKEITKKAPKAQRPSTPIKIVNNRNGNNVELPPKRGEKIQLETFDIPIPKGECICGPEEACLICMEQKDLVN